MPTAPEFLKDFPELCFPESRTAPLHPREVAARLGATTNQVYRLEEQGAFTGVLNIAAPKNKTERRCIRIPVSAYYDYMRSIFTEGWRPRHKPDPKQPELF